MYEIRVSDTERDYREVVDSWHGIDGKLESGRWMYYPWYIAGNGSVYHFLDDAGNQIGYDSYLEAHNHIARAVGAPTIPIGDPDSDFWQAHRLTEGG